MIDLTIYGKPSSTYAYMKEIINKTANKAKISLNLKEVTDTQVFIDRQIMSIPAYQLNGTIEERGNRNINEFLRELQHSLLKKANFGNMKKIFIPVDFTETSDNAVVYAINLSKHYNSALKLMHSYRPSPYAYEGTYVDPELQKIREEKLKKATNELNKKWIADDKFPIIDSEVRIGFAYDQIQILSSEYPEGWIVMGSSDSSKTMKNIFGSVSIAVAKDGDCPVFIVPPTASFTPLKKIAFCSSDNLDAQAIHELIEIAKPFNSEIHVIHVEDSKQSYNEFDLLNMLKNNYTKDKIKFSTIKGEDKVDLINNYCSINKINLLAMARRKRGVFGELFHKSFTKQMTITTDIPLLVLHK